MGANARMTYERMDGKQPGETLAALIAATLTTKKSIR